MVDIPYINWALAEKPLNWAVIWSIALLWLLLFHLITVAIKPARNREDTGGGISTPASPAGPPDSNYELHPEY